MDQIVNTVSVFQVIITYTDNIQYLFNHFCQEVLKWYMCFKDKSITM